MAEQAVEKKPEQMTSLELEALITTPPIPATQVAKPVPSPEETQKPKEEPKGQTQPEEKKPDVKPEEKLIAGRFKTHDELERAWAEEQKKIYSQGEEISRYKKQLGQFYHLDEKGDIVGIKQEAIVPQQQPVQQQVPQPSANEQIAALRPYFPPEFTDDQILAQVGLIGLMTNSALKNLREELNKELEPLHEVRFERDVEKQIKQVREKYKDDPVTFTELEDAVRERLDQVPPRVRAKTGSAETIFLAVRGERLPQVLKSRLDAQAQQTQTVEQKKNDAFVEGGGNVVTQTPPVNVSAMNSDQLAEFINNIRSKK